MNLSTPSQTRFATRILSCHSIAGILALAMTGLFCAPLKAAPKVILISLDGATPRLMQQYVDNNAIAPNTGVRLLEAKGVKATQNLTINPSLTAAAHIGIATGSDAAANDVPGNSFRLLATPSTAANNVSGFSAPIGGYQLNPVGMSPMVTAVPLWGTMRAAPYNKVVVTATWPGGDGIDVRVPGLTGSPIIQPSSERTVDLTIPFGAATSPFQRGFPLTDANFAAAPAQIVTDIQTQYGVTVYNARQASLETFTTFGVTFTIRAVAIDTTNDSVENYDTIVIYNDMAGQRILGPFTPAPLGTGPALIKPGTNLSALFFLEGSTVTSGVSQRAGTRYFVTALTPNLSTVRIARTSITYINRAATTVAAVLADIDDIHTNVGFWQPQPDFRIVQKLDAVPSTFATFPDLELEAIYEELVEKFTEYQKNIVLRALARKPNADLAMFYFEQPDGSGHQFLLTDPRQSTSISDNTKIGGNQDPAKVARYASYLQNAYVDANNAVQAVINAVGVDANGVPNSNILVTSDHGFEPFHSAVNITNLLSGAGVDLSRLRVVTSGPSVNVYIRLTGRTPGEAVTKSEYLTLQSQIASVLRNAADTNTTFTLGAPSVKLFDQVISRPLPADINDASFGLRTSEFIGQDSGDVFATLVPGYNFDGTQNPVVPRLGDAASNILSQPGFYGAHGYDPMLVNMSAIFYAAGPNISYNATPIPIMANMDIAPTIMRILGVPPAITVQGRALNLGPVANYLVKAGSRKTHGASGNFDVPLRLDAAPSAAGVECRRAVTPGAHQIVFSFANPVTSGTAGIGAGTATVGATTFVGNEMRVDLTGVLDAQNVTVSFMNVSDGSTLVNGSVNVSFLQGDVNGDRTVNVTDQNETKSLGFATPATTKTNFRADAVVNGSVNTADVAFVKSRNGQFVP